MTFHPSAEFARNLHSVYTQFTVEQNMAIVKSTKVITDELLAA